jgi:hypothetical protein
MNWILTIVVFITIVSIILVSLSKKGRVASPDYPYQRADALFSPAERSFYGVLQRAVEKNIIIFGKVRVADVVKPRKDISRGDWQKAFNKISGKHFDFLLCSTDRLSVICAIELNDRSHRSEKRKQRDDFLRGVCEVAKIPLIQIPSNSSYVIDDVKQLIAAQMNVKEPRIQSEKGATQKPESSKKVCPKCSSNMVVRVAKKGKNAGKQFWACGSYPKCRYKEAFGA